MSFTFPAVSDIVKISKVRLTLLGLYEEMRRKREGRKQTEKLHTPFLFVCFTARPDCSIHRVGKLALCLF